jgi:GNAT superfamily N-acetyltransferase
VVPRSWSLVWLAGAHREPPEATPADWRERWIAEATRFEQAPLPETFLDPPNAGLSRNDLQADAERRSLDTLALVRRLVLPAIVREAEDSGWWNAMDELDRPRTPEADDEPGTASASTLVTLDASALDGLRVVHGVLPVAGAGVATSLLRAAGAAGATIVGAVASDRLVGAAVAREGTLLAVGVTPGRRQRGLGRALLGRLVDAVDGPLVANLGLADRDPVKPLPVERRARIARSLLDGAGFRVSPAQDVIARHDATAIVARR